MADIAMGFQSALLMIFSGDSELYGIVGLSLAVSFCSVVTSTIIGVPLGILVGTHRFPLKGVVVRMTYTMMSLPPVIAGLVVFLFIMRKGPLGSWGINYTPTAMVIAQVILVTPIIMGLTFNIVKEKAPKINKLGLTLGANPFETLKLLIFEMRMGLLAAVVTGVGRAISEVGAVMIVGGNIKGKTRVMTTYIAQLKSM
ncbi:MAG: ABC transporter permease, partial [Anaerovorax sp.]